VPRAKGWYWPWIVVGILVAGIVPNLVLVAVAINDPSFAVEENYYEKARHWDEEMARRRASRALGWQVDLDVRAIPDRPGFRRIEAVVRDREGRVLDGCRVALETFHNARAARRERVELAVEDGRHVAELSMRRPGLWIFDIDVSRKGQEFSTTLRRELPPVLR